MSVIVPVYNPGRYLEDCIASLLDQDMPAGEFEVIFVDDGSTDDSPRRLDALAATHPLIQVIHQANSGWSGRPRNVGIEAAHGEYVFFLDNDDLLGQQALRRMYAFAKANDSDIVVGKMVGKGRGVPRELFRKTYPAATLADSPLIDSLTPHKLFRRAFLDKHGLRFPEGRRRLEDHVFVIAAYFAADTISVLSDYVCYYHVRRDDDSNAGFECLDPKSYFGFLREALDIVEANTEPGPLRDRLYRRWYRVEMLERLRGKRLLDTPAGQRGPLLDEVRLVVAERFGPGVAATLPPTYRVIGSLAQAGLLKDLLSFADWENNIAAAAELDDLGWQDGALQLTLTAELRNGDKLLTFAHRDGRDRLDVIPCCRLPDRPRSPKQTWTAHPGCRKARSTYSPGTGTPGPNTCSRPPSTAPATQSPSTVRSSDKCSRRGPPSTSPTPRADGRSRREPGISSFASPAVAGRRKPGWDRIAPK
nr:glycosyltransferase family A protein [Actinopolymorpha singaporensis]